MERYKYLTQKKSVQSVSVDNQLRHGGCNHEGNGCVWFRKIFTGAVRQELVGGGASVFVHGIGG
jgi:hypothetical protein